MRRGLVLMLVLLLTALPFFFFVVVLAVESDHRQAYGCAAMALHLAMEKVAKVVVEVAS
eukprot:CAMPEP_0194756158 /NCGR_PEP_ID=MMETSP0323_2-20130528/9905_1 /TAXON_ID=2866 ORGANISM="Crypthecodinium cohnii, Strain Seligo" /NCGR_SAMPLE_ID=MMETSP0323_2 /ASSEMBLY_ACC=CAM_ASM_000346 /LENGTH=58 /DNA_ID=CAMNT_0039675543 /DNA_START=459 /DNA_END=632 /DNA_ORIENTATION=-